VAPAGEHVKPKAAYLAPLESLRGLAAWSIVLYHVWSVTYVARVTWNLGPATVFMKPLQSGVTLFFVLSGFLLYRPFVQAALAGSRRPSLRRYIRNRALRIVPAYWLALLVAMAAGVTATAATANGTALGHLSFGRLGASLLFLQGYRPSTAFTGLPPAWSLDVEAAFYLVLPVAALLARRWVWWPPLVMLAAGFAGKVVLGLSHGGDGMRVFNPTWNATLAHSLIGHADLFGFGMAAAVIFTNWERGTTPAWINGGLVGRAIAYLGLPATVLGYYFIFPYLYDSIVAFFCAVLLLRATSPNSPRGFLHTRFGRLNGRISYSVFLWNYPVLGFLFLHHALLSGHGGIAFLGNAAMAVAAVAFLATLSYTFVEAPAMRLKRRAARTSSRASGDSVTAAVSAAR
jgi:peptidoglycan/LPS O-acetylase OafA/YrhL